jgi:hypothetical protein
MNGSKPYGPSGNGPGPTRRRTRRPAREERTAKPAVNAQATAAEQRFDWPICYEAENFLLNRFQAFLARSTFASRFSERLRLETGTLLIDWADSLLLSPDAESTLRNFGFTDDPLGETPVPTQTALWHPEALLPRVILDHTLPPAGYPHRIAIHVDSVSDFMAAHGLTGEPEGGPLSRFRRIAVSRENDTCFEAVERRGYRGWAPEPANPSRVQAALQAHEVWKTRRRIFGEDDEGFRQTQTLLDRVIALVGRDLACHIVFAEELD